MSKLGVHVPTLTPLQWRFVTEYLVDLNGAKAAERAGYKGNNLSVVAHKLLRQPDVLAEIHAQMAAREQRTLVTQDLVIAELAKLGFSNILDYVDIHEDGTATVNFTKVTRAQAAAIVEVITEERWVGKGDDKERVVSTRFKLSDKLNALLSLGKHVGAFKEAPAAVVNINNGEKKAEPFDPAELRNKTDAELAAMYREEIGEGAGAAGKPSRATH